MTTDLATTLGLAERDRLAELEAVVERGLEAFVEMGLALEAIRDERLYRETHATFEAYCKERWDFQRRYGDRLIGGARVAQLVSPIGLIANEAQARELLPLLRAEGEDAVREVFRILSDEYGDKLTAKLITESVRFRLALGSGAPELVALSALTPHPKNYRRHPPEQMEHIVASLRDNGWTRQIVVARDDTILAGHGLWQAATEMGLDEVPVIRLDVDSDSPEARRVLIGDNEIGKAAQYDGRILSDMLRDIHQETDRLVGTGFNAMQLRTLALNTRTAAEIPDLDAAAEWIGLAEYESVPLPIKLVLSFDNDHDRADVMAALGIEKPSKKNRRTVSSRWPPQEEEDPHSLRFATHPPFEGAEELLEELLEE